MIQIANQAHARRTDPATSREAAEAASGDMTQIQRRILAYAKRSGDRGFTDFEMYDNFKESGSSYRSRRRELCDAGLIADSGYVRRPHGKGRRFIVWIITDKGRRVEI